MKRSLFVSFGIASLFVVLGCGGSGSKTDAQRIEMLRPFSGEALINSTMQPVQWSGGDSATNVDIVYVSNDGLSTVLAANVPNDGAAEVRVDLLDLEQRQGGTVQVVSTNDALDGTMPDAPVDARGQVNVKVGSLAAFTWNGSAEEYWWMNVHNGKKKVLGTVGDMQSWTTNTLAIDHQQERIYIVAFDAANTQKVYSLHAKTGALLADPPVTGISATLVGILLVQSGMLVGFAWDVATLTEKMYSLDPATGVGTELGVVGDLQTWQTETAYSAANDEVYIGGITDTNECRLYAMNATTGAFLRAVPMTWNGMPIDGLLGLATNRGGDIIGYRWNGSAEQMMRLDPMTGVATELGIVGDLQWWSTVADINVTNDRAYVVGTNAANENKLYTLDTQTGALIDEVVVSDYPTNAVLVH